MAYNLMTNSFESFSKFLQESFRQQTVSFGHLMHTFQVKLGAPINLKLERNKCGTLLLVSKKVKGSANFIYGPKILGIVSEKVPFSRLPMIDVSFPATPLSRSRRTFSTSWKPWTPG